MKTNNMKINTMAEIQIGLNTHHQDQSILFNNFKVIKTIVNNPVNPIPDEVDTDVLIPSPL